MFSAISDRSERRSEGQPLRAGALDRRAPTPEYDFYCTVRVRVVECDNVPEVAVTDRV